MKASYIIFTLLYLSLLINAQNPNDIIVSDTKVFVDRKEFFIKAIAYQPEPLGIKHMSSDGEGGAGLCSVKMTAYGEWKSACLDSDYFDGSDDPERYPPGPKQWFKAIWERDLPKMKELGVNTIRLYNVNPTTRKASKELLSTGWNGIKKPYGKDHVPFMDYAHSMGFKVIFPLVSDEEVLRNDSMELLEQKTKNLIDEVGNHPALLMWSIGNELFIEKDSNRILLERVNSLASFTRQYTLEKYNRRVPITHCVVDIPSSYEFLLQNLDIEIFCANAGYRSDSLTDLFEGNSEFPGFTKLIQDYKKPLFIGEIGWLSVNNSINYERPDWFNRVWKDVLDHIDDGCVGGAYFEYSDEKYKKDAPIDQIQLGLVELKPYIKDGKSSEDDEDFFYPDIVVEKEIIYDAVKSGVIDGVPINFNTDVFKYLNREPAELQHQNEPFNPISEPAFQSGNENVRRGLLSNILMLFLVYFIQFL